VRLENTQSVISGAPEKTKPGAEAPGYPQWPVGGGGGGGLGFTNVHLIEPGSRGVGGLGGVPYGAVALLKSKNSVISGIAASRAVRVGSLKRVSINFKIAVKSAGV
jgi:hypothetical protein